MKKDERRATSDVGVDITVSLSAKMCSCPSRTDEPYEGQGHNQSPNHLAADLTTNQDLNGIANSRETRNRDARAILGSSAGQDHDPPMITNEPPDCDKCAVSKSADGNLTTIGRRGGGDGGGGGSGVKAAVVEVVPLTPPPPTAVNARPTSPLSRLKDIFVAYLKFIGPGFMIAVAYSKSFCTELCFPPSDTPPS